MLLSYMSCYSQKTEEDVCLSNIMKMNSDIQQGKVNTRHIKVFLDCFIDHTNNVEILEFRNSVLFKLMEYCPEEFICFMSKKIQIFFRMSAKISKILFMTILIFIEYTIKY